MDGTDMKITIEYTNEDEAVAALNARQVLEELEGFRQYLKMAMEQGSILNTPACLEEFYDRFGEYLF